MPLPPLADPPSRAERLRGLARALPTVTFLSSSLLAINAIQAQSLLLRPVSRRAFRRVNRFAADTWWSWGVTTAQLLYGTRVEITGDEVPDRENAILVANHQQMPDINFLMFLARTKHRLGDLKWFVKHSIKYVPGVGWGMVFLDCVFVRRNWSSDQATIRQTFARLIQDQVPMWLVTFPEGTRITEGKLAESQRYAHDHGLEPPAHVLIPRTKGFVATVQGLRQHVGAVYDVTIGYEQGVPTLWQYVKGYAKVAHLHVRRFPIETLPSDPEVLADWLLERFREKDELLAGFYASGRFADPSRA